MTNKSYTPGKGYKDGWNDRYAGKPKTYPMEWDTAKTDHDIYCDEYRIGYADASRKILEDAKRSIEEMKQGISQYLTEDSDPPIGD